MEEDLAAIVTTMSNYIVGESLGYFYFGEAACHCLSIVDENSAVYSWRLTSMTTLQQVLGLIADTFHQYPEPGGGWRAE